MNHPGTTYREMTDFIKQKLSVSVVTETMTKKDQDTIRQYIFEMEPVDRFQFIDELPKSPKNYQKALYRWVYGDNVVKQTFYEDGTVKTELI